MPCHPSGKHGRAEKTPRCFSKKPEIRAVLGLKEVNFRAENFDFFGRIRSQYFWDQLKSSKIEISVKFSPSPRTCIVLWNWTRFPCMLQKRSKRFAKILKFCNGMLQSLKHATKHTFTCKKSALIQPKTSLNKSRILGLFCRAEPSARLTKPAARFFAALPLF